MTVFRYIGVRNYAKQAIKRSRTLSPNVAKASLDKSSKNSSKQFVAGPPNTGEFGRLHYVEKRSRIAHKNTIEKIDSFSKLRIVDPVRNAVENNILGHLETKKPTAIQTLAVKAIRSTRHQQQQQLQTFLLAAETGSGKTLAYLSSIMSHLKEEEELKGELWEKLKDAPVVRSVVLVPTLELVSQVESTIRKMSGTVKLSCMAVGGQGTSTRSRINKRVDILVTTPGRFLTMFDPKSNSDAKGNLHYCKYAVVDEADTLMDDSFCQDTHNAVSKLSNLRQLLFCSATIPRSFDKIMRKTYPNALRIVTPGIHKVPRHIDFRVVEVFKPPFLNSKSLALQQALYSIHHDNTEAGNVKRVVVFVNKTDSIEKVVDGLKEKGYPAVGVSGAVPKQERTNLLEDFISPAKPVESDSQIKVQVLVTTDLMARGIDMQNIRNVILYDLPQTSIDLLHRAGRTGRLGKRGRVFVFVDRKESQGWVKGLERIVRNGMPLA